MNSKWKYQNQGELLVDENDYDKIAMEILKKSKTGIKIRAKILNNKEKGVLGITFEDLNNKIHDKVNYKKLNKEEIKLVDKISNILKDTMKAAKEDI